MKALKQLRKELGIRKTDKRNFEIVTVKADIHCDGDVYIENRRGTMIYVGKLGESTFAVVPCPFYEKIKKFAKRIK